MLRTSAGSRSATFIKVSMADTMNTCQSGHQIFQFKNMHSREGGDIEL